MYTRVCVAGTFDGIHAGHEALLRKAFEVGDRVLIGITTDEYVSRFKSSHSSPRSHISHFESRKRALLRWLAAHSYTTASFRILPIDDPFEPAASDSSLNALVVSEETRDRGEELNVLRKSRSLTPLTLIVIPMVLANGKLVMPESLRLVLAKPLGPIVQSPALQGMIITVGDVTTKTFLDAGIVPQLMIVDNKVNRKPFSDLQSSLNTLIIYIIKVVSGPGYISQEAIDAIRQAMHHQNKPILIDVEGEEDLLVLPVISEAQMGTVVYYGQPGKGMVKVVVNEVTKQKAQLLLSRFDY